MPISVISLAYCNLSSGTINLRLPSATGNSRKVVDHTRTLSSESPRQLRQIGQVARSNWPPMTTAHKTVPTAHHSWCAINGPSDKSSWKEEWTDACKAIICKEDHHIVKQKAFVTNNKRQDQTVIMAGEQASLAAAVVLFKSRFLSTLKWRLRSVQQTNCTREHQLELALTQECNHSRSCHNSYIDHNSK